MGTLHATSSAAPAPYVQRLCPHALPPQLTGTIPGEAIAAISSLEELKLKDNNLQGSIPEELCDMPCLKWLRVSVGKAPAGPGMQLSSA